MFYSKAPVPVFSKDAVEEDAKDEQKAHVENDYTEKLKPLSSDPKYIKLKEQQDMAENSLKQWK